MGTDGSSPLRSTGESANFGPPLLGWTPPTCKSASHVTVAGCLNVKPLLNDKPDETIIDKAAPNWHRLAGILDARLATSKWLAGDNVTIADIAVAAPMHVHKWQRLLLDDHPNRKRWMADVEQLPCWQKAQGAVERALRLK